ncbi:Proline/betaine transporter [Rickettsia akari str. Hartford]|uniref:Proline/betaine transporter n=1 Tax=Rickettsia akari (strain Hartford) TaxID=293614 RepID=A8GP51_RICAH|nr:Proline/betaine transporter [Rickettsia akari str. Hartford]
MFYARLPVLKRFTCGSFIFALSRASMFAVSSFGTIYLIDYFNHWVLLFFIIPILIGYTLGVKSFYKVRGGSRELLLEKVFYLSSSILKTFRHNSANSRSSL